MRGTYSAIRQGMTTTTDIKVTEIQTMYEPIKGHELSRAIRRGDMYSNYGWVPLVMADGELMCPKCVIEEHARIRCAAMNHNRYRDGWAPLGFEIHWEGPPDYCCNCNCEIPTACGDPTAEGT